MALYCNTLEGNMQYGDDPYCFTPSTQHIHVIYFLKQLFKYSKS